MEKTLLEQKFDKAPWTIQQTFLGVLLTLVPWVVISFGLSTLNARTTLTTPLSPQTDLIDAVISFFFSLLVEGAFLIAPLYFANRSLQTREHVGEPRRSSLPRVLGLRRFSAANTLLLIIVLLFSFFVIDALYQYLLTLFHLHLQTNDQVILERGRIAPITVYATLVASVLVAPFCEEIFFRGFLLPGLLQEMPVWSAIILSALIFAIAHADFGSFAPLFFIGIALAFLRWRTHSLWPGIILHLLNNAIGALQIILLLRSMHP